MDEISENISYFEFLLKNRSSKKPPTLYTSSEDRNKLLISSKTSKISANDVLANVSRQVKALQNADTVSCKRVGNTLDKYKKREFMTVDMLPVDRVVHQKKPTKFETQCVSDTQLINVVENAEIVDKHGGVTQEFDKTFCQNSDNDSDDKINDNSLKLSTETDIGNDIASEIINNDVNSILKKNDEDNKLFDKSNVITWEMDTITCYKSDVIADFNDYYNNSQETQGFNKCAEIFNVSEEDADRPSSPVLNTNRKSTASPLVVDLYAFEKFENLANPIIEEHGDLTIAKRMINSQIIGKEILVSAHNYDNIGRDSPVLGKIDSITTNFNEDDVRSICTCSNSCINRDVKCTNKQATKDIILTSENKKTQSKVIKAEIKDEILFSSDEEYEYFHKSIQELPLTCALETSFYDTSDVLDKTMYVGFQTASNKSIQINTDSFTKAKSILSDVDYEENGKTLSDLVEIFDSGKAVNESVENVKVTRNELDFRRTGGTDIQASSKIEHSDKNLSQPSKKLMFEEKMYETLENVSLTALEQIREANDEIRMSQIINFKSTLRSANLSNSIISDRKVNDTLDNMDLTMLEQNKEKDDDIMMSQVLTFQSISRTPHVVASVSHDSQLRKVLAKRKLEGFKTASNKKIKLSDNALARCKKVFQDIDLNDSKYLSSKSNFIDTEEITRADYISHDFDNSYDASKASSEVNHTSKENNISDNVSYKMISGDDYFENIDLQINDQIILQEFEENEMHLKETNNNACVGFKTASNKNIAISDVAMAATKHVFHDIMTIAATNDSTIKVTDDCIDDKSKYESVFKSDAADLIKMVDKKIKPRVDALRNIKSNVVNVALRSKQADDHESYNIQKLSTGEFVGFKTASHKEIIISAQAREKVKAFYRDLDTEPTQNVNKEGAMNSNTVKTHINNVADEFSCGIDTQDFLAVELTHIEELFKDNIVENKNPASPTFQGFQTASKKAIVISEIVLKKSKKLFEDITNKECDIKCQSTKDNQQDPDPGNKIKTQPSKDTNNLESFDGKSQSKILLAHFSNETSQFNNMTNKTPDLTGCQTSCNINVCVSKKGKKANKTLFPDNVLSDQRNIEQVGDSETSLEHNNVICHDTKMSGTIQNEFLKETHAMSQFQNVNSAADTKIMNTESPMFAGFKTASAKPICISAAAIEKNKKLFSEFEVKDDDLFDHDYGSTPDLKPSPSRFLGFQTANKKKINISAKALAKSKQLLSDLELKEKNNDYDKKNINNPDNNLKDTSVSFKESNTTNEPCKSSTSKFKGFQTASNKAVNISKEALAKSKQLFQDVDIYDKECDTLYEKITTKEDNKNLFHDVRNSNLSGNAQVFKGLQTASNKTVIITEKALENSKKLFEDFNLSQLNKEPNTTVGSNGLNGNKATANDIINDMKYKNLENKFQAFQTASNKTVKVSQQALENTKDLFRDFQLEKGNGDNTLVLKGFQTASNKQIQISEKALAVNKKLFEDINLSQFNTDPSTTVQAIINDIKDPTASIPENKFTVFQTASNKKVIVSDQALVKTKDVLKDIHIEKDNAIHTNVKAPIFKGFQTASNKKVAISEKALAKSKKLFEDINLSQIELEPTKKADLDTLQFTKADDVANKIREPVSVPFGGFQTASDREVKISEQASAKTKDIFKDIHVEKENDILLKHDEIKTPDLKTNADVINSKNNNFSPTASKLYINRDIIDTQVLNDFESTLNTEDFSKHTPVSKRSGSPILSCPRAKKRKFETPYRTSKKVEPRNVFVPPKLVKTYNFNEDYKRNKKYTLKDIVKLEKEQTQVDVDQYLSEFDFDSLLNFVFNGKRNDYTGGKMSIEDLKKIFLDSVNKRIVPEGWLDNHIKLIIWKLLSYELKFPNVMKNTCTVRNVLEQLKYRYDKELYHVQRPMLRKILEKDEVPSKTMVLCVAAIYVDNISVISVPPSSQNVDLLVTDGWYCIKACLDRMLIRLVVSGSIVIGTKIAVCGAELINCEQGVAPWEDTSSVRLKLHGNSTRRARWLARLGARAGAGAGLVPCGLRAARADGGHAAVVRLAITRLYPPVTVERMDDGSTVTLSERLENIRQMKYESERQVIMEKLYEEVEKEMSDQDSQDSEGCSNEKGCMDSGSQIAKCMMKTKDPDEYRSHLTKSQSRMLEDHNSKQREKLAERVRGRFQEKLDKYGLKTVRNVVQLLKVRVADFTEKAGSVEVTKGYLSIWRPSAAVLELVTEGAWIEILNVIPTGIRNSEIQLSTGRQTVFNPYKQKNEKYILYSNTLQRKCYEIKEITQNPSMTTDYNEIDTAGMIFCIEPSTKEFHEQSFQNVYLADADRNIICVNFWGGLKKFGYENILDTGQIITCVNLQKRAGNTRKSIPQYRVTELSYFTKTPKSKKAMEITNEMANKLSKIKDKFCEDCIVLKNNYSIFKTRNNENVSPYRIEYNIPKNIMSPRNCDVNLNLTGLDFESSFDTQEISPQALLRKKKVNEKIEKIRLNYGEPPPLSSIHIINKSKNASATYKSPLISNLEGSKSPLKMASPVSVNRTFVKNANPVKLNFSGDLNESVDHFAEDFDASPPLSLDSDTVFK